MATSSGAISTAFIQRSSLANFQSNSPQENKSGHPIVKIVTLGFGAAALIWAVYKIVNSSNAKKISTVPFPQNELNAQGFIQVPENYFANMFVAPSYSIVEVKVILEDVQGRRIATRYMPTIKGINIFSPLPFDREVVIRCKITRKHLDTERLLQGEMSQIKFKVDQIVGRYILQRGSTLPSVKLEISNPYIAWVAFPANEGSQAKFAEAKIELLDKNEINFALGNLRAGALTLINRTVFDRVLQINLNTLLINGHLKAPLFYSVINGEEKSLQLRYLIKDWKAAFRLERQTKIFYKNSEGDVSNFSIASVRQISYEPEVK